MNDESLRRANALLAAMARQVAVGDIWSGAPSDLGRSAGIDDALAVARAMRALRSRGRLEQVGDGYRLLDGKPVEVGERGTIPPVERPARHAGPRAGRAKTDEGPTDPATGLSYAAIGREVVDRLIDLGKEVATLRAEMRGAKEEVRDALASRLEAEGIDAFLDHWLTVALFGGFVPDGAEQAIRRANTVAGLASSLRSAGTGHQESLWTPLARLEHPVLAMAGSRDAKFAALAQRLADTMPHAAPLLIDGAAHMAHLERPDVVTAALETFLDADA